MALAVAMCSLVTLAALARAETVSPEPFFRFADYGDVRLSPSGRYLGALVPLRGRRVLAILDLDKKTSQIAGGVDDGDIAWFEWVNDERVVFSIFDAQAGAGDQRGGGLFALDRDGSDLRELAPTIIKQRNRIALVYRYAVLHTLLRDGSDDILVVANDNNVRYPDLYRMNTRTGRKTFAVLDKPGDVVSWAVDRAGVVRGVMTVEQGGLASHAFYRRADGAPWEKIGDFTARGGRIQPIAFDADGTMIVSADVDRDTAALYRYDPATKKLGEPLLAHPKADIRGGLLFDERTKRIVGVRYEGERPGVAWFDDERARLQASVDAALPGKRNALTGGSSRARLLVYSYSDTDPGSYYLLDPEKKSLEFVASVRKSIDPAKMPARLPVRYVARDGLEIPAYVTLPKGKESAKNLPLVVDVHGGPFLRGTHWRWDPEAAYFASLGYAVLQPDFRGSRGWGRKLFEAGWKQWGRAMQDDLDDGADWLAKQGTIDPKRVCIFGASYGGYAVMMGLARDPDRWRCGVNLVGVTDISLMFNVTWSDFSDSDWLRYLAKEMIGDPDKDAALFKASSPLENASRIKAPVLMAYGGADRRVPFVHGETMRDALLKQGTPVEWLFYSDEGHGFIREQSRFDFYSRVAKFLDANLAAPQ